jgi:hypothetical protein
MVVTATPVHGLTRGCMGGAPLQINRQRERSRSSTASDSVCPRSKAICKPSGENANCAIRSDVKCVSWR